MHSLHEQLDAYKSEGVAGGSGSFAHGSFGEDDDYEAQSMFPFDTSLLLL